MLLPTLLSSFVNYFCTEIYFHIFSLTCELMFWLLALDTMTLLATKCFKLNVYVILECKEQTKLFFVFFGSAFDSKWQVTRKGYCILMKTQWSPWVLILLGWIIDIQVGECKVVNDNECCIGSFCCKPLVYQIVSNQSDPIVLT